MSAKAALDCIGRRRQQGVIQKCQRFVQVRREQLVERAANVFEATHAAAKSGQLVKSSIGSAAAIEQAIDLIHDVAQRAQVWQASGDSLECSLLTGRWVMFDEQVTVVEQVRDLLLDPFLALGCLLGVLGRPSPAQVRHCGLQLLAYFGHRAKHGFGQFLDYVEFADLMLHVIAEYSCNGHRIQRRSIGCDALQRQPAGIQFLPEMSKEPDDVIVRGIVIEHLADKALEVVVVDNRQHTEWSVVQPVCGNVTTEVRQDRVQIVRGNVLLSLFSPRPRPSSESWQTEQTRGDPAISATMPPDTASRPPRPSVPPSQPRGAYNEPSATPGHSCRH